MNQARLTEIQEGILSVSKDATVSTSYLDNEISKGKIFSAFFTEAFTGVQTKNYTIDAPLGAFLLPLSAQCTAGTLSITLYEDSDYADGVAVALQNRNRVSTNTATTELAKGASGTDKGDEIATIVVGTSGRGSFLGGGGGSLAPYILTDKTYLIEVTSTETCTATIGIAIGEY